MSAAQRWRAGLAAAVALAGIAAWMVVTPRLVARRLEPALRQRLGWSLERIGRVGLQPKGLRLSGMELVTADGRRLGRSRMLLPWNMLGRRSGKAPRLEGATLLAPGAEVGWSAELRDGVARLVLTGEDLPLAAVAPLLPTLPWHHNGDGRIDFSLRLEAPPGALAPAASEWPVRGKLRLSDGAFAAPLLAPRPVTGVTLEAEFGGTWHPGESSLSSVRGSLGRAPLRVVLEGGELTWRPGRWRLDLEADLPESDCAAVLAALPPDLLGEAVAFRLEGRLGGHLRLRVDATDLPGTELGIRLDDGCRFMAVPAAVEQVGAPEFAYGAAAGAVRRTGPAAPGWVPLQAISPLLVGAVLVQEDAGFYEHAGFSVPDIRASLVRDLEAGGTRRGASTITMQLARSLFLDTQKTLARKMQEVLYAWWLEHSLDKDRILELYLNVVEFGPGLHGAGEAADHYFGRTTDALSPAQAAFLASILPAPHRRHRQVEQGGLPEDLVSRVRSLLRRMAEAGRLDPSALPAALREAGALEPALAGGDAP